DYYCHVWDSSSKYGLF
nr:immunoglobulin light chain junction region [Macaca mulatta]MOW66296.1 immunoglobulin light chain junction region [Macaca mulatta]MOW66338.1 immunoglobulin light chain junction region [Macaca mulatta]MOW66521.1 immunoglobulin light chain junction region [Macaca mulatta]MOW66644.1 immunoglobulin light chain junction region [Macaca mulatta]